MLLRNNNTFFIRKGKQLRRQVERSSTDCCDMPHSFTETLLITNPVSKMILTAAVSTHLHETRDSPGRDKRVPVLCETNLWKSMSCRHSHLSYRKDMSSFHRYMEYNNQYFIFFFLQKSPKKNKKCNTLFYHVPTTALPSDSLTHQHFLLSSTLTRA